ncbi:MULTISPECIES: hypothetical protein [Streptomyces]|uniref:hypothetical protein n=1 Tax=Streptomyces TaxID=1883 RepID=UPI001675D944|nr:MULTISPECIES: hypothetical protein [Streptomyces]MBK3521413.1 hypothetical protein [Streptomyces sp. MBT70]
MFFGLAAALVVPLGLGWHRSRPGPTVLLVVLYGGYAVSSYMDRLRPWVALCATVLVALGVILRGSPGESERFGFPDVGSWWARTLGTPSRWGAVATGTALLMAAWIAGGRTAALFLDLVESDRAAVFASALLISAFGGGVLAKAATRPVRREIEELEEGPERTAAMELMSGGPVIGILERGLLFAFLAAGQPEAAALVLAAKSLVRVPNAEHGKHASEYFLIGTLASVIAALAMGMAARSAVGLSAL